MPKPLEGIKVLEWAIWLAGPGTTMMLGDMGADVIKIEQPLVGDPSRGITRLEGMPTGHTTAEREFTYMAVNRNKKSIAVDVTKPKGKEIIYRLIPKFDVFLQNFRQEVRDRANGFFTSLDHPVHGRIEIMANPVKFSKMQETEKRAAPQFNENTLDILSEIGYTEIEIRQLKDQHVIS
jgi:crotonobetainyl-CoA:carnitine CoA-transferase CaiB-like acyl-CoA transferase